MDELIKAPQPTWRQLPLWTDQDSDFGEGSETGSGDSLESAEEAPEEQSIQGPTPPNHSAVTVAADPTSQPIQLRLPGALGDVAEVERR
jgi:hypothetical protein